MAMDWSYYPVYFDRENFNDIVLKVLTQYDNELMCYNQRALKQDTYDFIDSFLSIIEAGYEGFEYYAFCKDDDYYIIHLDSGTIVSWYKHLGRSACSNRDLTAYDLQTFIKGFIKDIIE